MAETTKAKAPVKAKTPAKPSVKKVEVKKPAANPVEKKPVAAPVKKTVAKPAAKPVPKQVAKPVAKPAPKPVAKPVPVKKPVAKPAPVKKAEPQPILRKTKGKGRNLGHGIPTPEKEPEEFDAHCPFFGTIALRGRILQGTVISAKMHRTVKVEINRRHYIPKYQRYEKRRTRLLVHNPPSVNAQVGDVVRMMEAKPISKTKHFVIVERVTQVKAPVVKGKV